MDWSKLQEVADRRAEEEGVLEHPDPANGPAHPDVHLRLFGKEEADVRVLFYRDHAAWCPYCQRVWMVLEEKQIPYRMEKINMRCYGDKPAAFLQKVPSGLLPVIELDGTVITESAEIMSLLDSTFPERPLMPPAEPSPPLAARVPRFVRRATGGDSTAFTDNSALLPDAGRLREAAEALMRLERDIFALWCRWLYRPLDAAGEDSARATFESAMTMVDDALAQVGGSGPFFLGEEVSMVDLMFVPFLERQNASLLYWKGFKLRNGGWQHIDRWFEAFEKRSSYSATQSDHYTHCWDIPPQYGTCWPAPGTETFAKAINGTDGSSWKLPLSPLNSTSFEARSNAEADGEAAKYRVQAARKLVGNHAAVARFALRAAPGSTPGKNFTAPLVAPQAKADTTFEPQMAAALQCTAHALLEGTEAAESAFGSGEWLDGQEGSRAEAVEAVVAGLGYLRDRVGVPRDLQLPAARQLRAHLNFTIDLVSSK